MQDFYINLVEYLYENLEKALDKIFLEKGKEKQKINFLVKASDEPQFGDFATNISMICAKVFKINPLQLAKRITNMLNLDEDYFSHFEIKNPGFINFFLTEKCYFNGLKYILEKGENFGKTDFGKGKRVILEYVSANPTGPMHIGNARGGAIGDGLAECFSFSGFDVCREFYVNDAGNQIEKFKNSLFLRYKQLYEKDLNFQMPKDCYLGEDIILHAKNFAKIYKDKYINSSEEEVKKALQEYALNINIKNLKQDLLKYKVEYDSWFFESSLYENDEVLKAIDLLKEKGYTYEKDGAVWFNYIKLGGNKDEVLIRENGIPTYFASDIAYHLNKFKKRKFDFVINIWGADHHGHVERLKAALKALGLDVSCFVVVIMQMVRLVKKGQAVKLSKRSGNTISLIDLLDLIPIDVARFFFNMKDPNSHFDFDLDLAEEESDNNPVYYVQYAYARICGILKKLKELGYSPSLNANFSLLNSKDELNLIKCILKFANEIVEVVRSYNPSKIVKFAVETASCFHRFYVSCKIKGQAKDLLIARLSLCEAVRLTFKNVFKILKIKAKEEV